MLKIFPCEPCEITKIECPYCCAKIPRIGIKKHSRIKGLTIKCRRCGKLFEVESE